MVGKDLRTPENEIGALVSVLILIRAGIRSAFQTHGAAGKTDGSRPFPDV